MAFLIRTKKSEKVMRYEGTVTIIKEYERLINSQKQNTLSLAYVDKDMSLKSLRSQKSFRIWLKNKASGSLTLFLLFIQIS